MITKSHSKSAVGHGQKAERTEPSSVAASPLYGVAMLKIAMELKKPEPRALAEIMSGVLAKMRIPEPEFMRFLEQNGGLLRTIARSRGY